MYMFASPIPQWFRLKSDTKIQVHSALSRYTYCHKQLINACLPPFSFSLNSITPSAVTGDVQNSTSNLLALASPICLDWMCVSGGEERWITSPRLLFHASHDWRAYVLHRYEPMALSLKIRMQHEYGHLLLPDFTFTGCDCAGVSSTFPGFEKDAYLWCMESLLVLILCDWFFVVSTNTTIDTPKPSPLDCFLRVLTRKYWCEDVSL